MKNTYLTKKSLAVLLGSASFLPMVSLSQPTAYQNAQAAFTELDRQLESRRTSMVPSARERPLRIEKTSPPNEASQVPVNAVDNRKGVVSSRQTQRSIQTNPPTPSMDITPMTALTIQDESEAEQSLETRNSAGVARTKAEMPQALNESEITDSAFDMPVPLGKMRAPLLAEAVKIETNTARAAHGLPPLALDGHLSRAATLHTDRMVADSFFAHQDPYRSDLRTPTDRARAVGIVNPNIAENIITEMAMEYESGESVYAIDPRAGLFSRSPNGSPLPRHTYRSIAKSMVDRWMDSPGHRANILAPGAIQMGIGSTFYTANGFPSFVVAQEFQWSKPVKVDASQ